MRSRRTQFLVSVSLLATLLLAVKLDLASAGPIDSCPCVVLIEIDGLEPHDVTRERTPFLWALSHPAEDNGGVAGQDADATAVNDGVSGASRNGWIWQAARGVMSASTAANTAALLTGGYPEQTAIPGDEFVSEGNRVGVSGSADTETSTVEQLTEGHLAADSLLKLVEEGSEEKKKSAAFVGNPVLKPLMWGDADVVWGPEPAPSRNPPSPAYCDPPARVPENPEWRPNCIAPDHSVLDNVIQTLGGGHTDVAFTFIHLAELGAVKRRSGDVEARADQTVVSGQEQTEARVTRALAEMDSAIATFVNRYKDSQQGRELAAKYPQTYFMIVGSHGYEPTVVSQRVPSPGADAASDVTKPTPTLEDWFAGSEPSVWFAPQGGTLGTVFLKNATDAIDTRRATLDRIRKAILSVNDQPVCQQGNPLRGELPTPGEGVGGCVSEVLYMREELLLANTTAADRKKLLLDEAHPTWHMTNRDLQSGALTPVGGDLLVVMEPGWSVGRAIPGVDLAGGEEGAGSVPLTSIDNPYTGSAGGPRNRAVAALINGPRTDGVRQVKGTNSAGRYPVTRTPDDGQFQDDPAPRFGQEQEGALVADPTLDRGLIEANANPGDDADLPGYERQAESVDFAPTIAALLQISVQDSQLAGRFLQEAFQRSLFFFEEKEDLGEVLPDPPPPPEPEPIILPPPVLPDPPPPPPGFNFHGLLRNLRAAVGDKKGRSYSRARAGSKLSYILLRADFGKPDSKVTLTFYTDKLAKATARSSAKKKKKKSKGPDITKLKALAQFAPFKIKRGQVRLTLKVPEVFKPTHLGIVVQQARRLRKPKSPDGKSPPVNFEGFGRKAGGIFRIQNAEYLHSVKKKPRKARRKKRGR